MVWSLTTVSLFICDESVLFTVLLGNAHRVSSLQYFISPWLHTVWPQPALLHNSHMKASEIVLPLCILCEMNGWHYPHITDRREKHKEKYLLNTGSQYVFIFQANKNILRAMEILVSMTAFTHLNCKSCLQYPGSFVQSTSSTTLDKAEVLWNASSCIVWHGLILPTGQVNSLFFSLPLTASVFWKLCHLIFQRIFFFFFLQAD